MKADSLCKGSFTSSEIPKLENMWLIYLLFFFSSFAFANQNTVSVPDHTARQGILEFEYDPDGGTIIARISDANGTKPLAADTLEFDAIGDSGNTVKANMQRLEKNVFKGTLNLPEGEWNLIAKVKTSDQNLHGQYTLGVGKSVTEGRFPLELPNPEVSRLSWIVGALIGVPLGLGLLIGIMALLSNLINPKRPKPAA